MEKNNFKWVYRLPSYRLVFFNKKLYADFERCRKRDLQNFYDWFLSCAYPVVFSRCISEGHIDAGEMMSNNVLHYHNKTEDKAFYLIESSLLLVQSVSSCKSICKVLKNYQKELFFNFDFKRFKCLAFPLF